MPRPANRSSILPIATTGIDAARQAIEQRLAGRRQRVVVAVRRPREMAGRADERPRDHAADAEPLADEPVGDLAVAIQLRDRHDVFVRGNLKHAVGRRVDDQRAGAHVLGAELVDDRGARRRLVAEHAAAGQARELRDDLRREAVGKRRERAVEHDAHHLPVPGDRVLPRRRLGHAAVRTERRTGRNRGDRRDRGDLFQEDLCAFSAFFALSAVSSGPSICTRRSRPRLRSVGIFSGTRLRDVADRVAALIAVRRRVRQLADADAVHDDDDGAGERRLRGRHAAYWCEK